MKRRAKKKLISPWHLLVGAVVVVFGAWNLLFSPSVRESVGLSREPVDIGKWFASLFGKEVELDSSAIAVMSSDDLRAFTEALVNREVKVTQLPPEISAKNAEGDSDADKSAAEERKQAEKARIYDLFWPVAISGTFRKLETNESQAMIAGKYCSVGDQLLSSKEKGRCGYKILGIGNRCVWMLAINREGEVPETPEIESWPDISFVKCVKRGDRLVPESVHFACGVDFGVGKRFKISKNDVVEYKIVKIWQRGACFEIQKDGNRCYIACMLVIK